MDRDLTAERLRELLDYDSQTGMFRWVTRPSGRAKSGWFAGSLHGQTGYRKITIDGASYRAHRLAWLYVHGKWPKRYIDHINREPSDNRIANLRDVSGRLNSQNNGKLGVERRERSGRVRWRARITHFGRLVNVGTFDTKEEAEAALLEAKTLMHPGFLIRNPPDAPKTSA